MEPATPPDIEPKESSLQVIVDTRPPPKSAVIQVGSDATLTPVIKNEAAPIVPRILQIKILS